MGSRPDSPLRYFQVGLATAVAMIVSWPWFGGKGIIFFIPFWILFEVYYRLRLRGLVACPMCGFDPYLYLADADRAKKAIEAHWRKKFEERGIPFPDPHPESNEFESPGPKRAPRVINASQHFPLNPE